MDKFTIIKDRVSVHDLAQRHGIALKQAGGRYIGLCPFHNEKTPSFTVFPDGGYKCFGCGAAGRDSIDFVAAMEGLPSLEAAKRIDANLGLGLFDYKLSKDEREQLLRQTAQKKADRELLAAFDEWERRHHISLCERLWLLQGLLPRLAVWGDDFAACVEELAWLEIELDMLDGGIQDKLMLFERGRGRMVA